MIKALWNTSKTSLVYLAIMISVLFWPMVSYKALRFLNHHGCFSYSAVRFLNHQRCFFITILKIMKNLQYILWRSWKNLCDCSWKKMCSCLWTYYFCAETVRLLLNILLCRNRKCADEIFLILRIVWLLLETFQCFLMNVRLLLKRH